MVINIDADQRNADWIKTVSWEYPTDVEHFLHFIGGPQALEHFMTLPVAEQMPPTLRLNLAVATGLKVPMKSAKFDPNELRDRLGQWVRGGGAGAGGGTGPMAGVKFTIGTLDENEQKTVHETLDRLGAKYPAVTPLIRTVAAKPLKHVWGQFHDKGEMRLTNLGRKHEDMHDPDLAGTVAHEFGHVAFRRMAGITGPNDPPPRTPSFNRQLDAGVPVSVIRERIQEGNAVVEEYNAMIHQQNAQIDTVVEGMYQRIRDELGGDPDTIYDQLKNEFAGGPGYVVTRGGEPTPYSDYLEANPQEVLAQAFGSYETGKHGRIADIVGHTVEEHFKVKS